MSLALAGLIALQVYWIGKAIELSEEHFDTSVRGALNQVARRLEQRELNVFFIEAAEEMEIIELKGPETGSEGQHIEHSITVKIKGEGNKRQYTRLRKVATDQDSFDVNRIRSIDVRKGPLAQQLHDSLAGRALRREMVFISTDSLAPGKPGAKTIEWDSRYVNAFEQALAEMHGRGAKIEDRIDSLAIDSLIAQALQDQGVYQDYRFWVEAEEKGEGQKTRFVFKTGNLNEAELQEASYRVQLFPDQGLDGRSFLHAHFPRQRLYTMRSVWWMTAASVLFTSIVLVCFVLTIRTIFRQKKLSEIKNDFINNMTHELKTPLATISLAADSLRALGGQWNPGQVDRYTGIIKEENQRMHRQVERVLQAARFDRGEVALRTETLDAHELILSAMNPFLLRVEERKGELMASLEATQDTVLADRVHLTNVLQNLLDNAEKYSPDAPHIRVSTANEGGYLVIRVSDRGRGMRKADHAYIFDRFYRVPSGDLHEVRGFGLGLSYVREIVAAHGGEITVSSKPGAGSTFTVYFPLSPSSHSL